MSTRNISLGGKGGRCVGLTTLPTSCVSPTWNPQGLSRRVQGLFNYYKITRVYKTHTAKYPIRVSDMTEINMLFRVGSTKSTACKVIASFYNCLQASCHFYDLQTRDWLPYDLQETHLDTVWTVYHLVIYRVFHDFRA